MIRFYTIIFFLIAINLANSQNLTEIKGVIKASDDVEGVHILNKSSNKFTTTDQNGNFSIAVKLNDTLLVSSLKYFAKRVPINNQILISRSIKIQLEEIVNELDEVTVGKILTGDLLSDIQNTDGKREINFFDVGIPGNTNLPITQKERRLQEADHGKFLYFYGIGFAINVNKILNRVSGRTKRLKLYVALEERDECMEKASYKFADRLFTEDTYLKEEIVAFFFYASEDPDFKEVCLIDNDMAMFTFLKQKHKVYLHNLALTAEEN